MKKVTTIILALSLSHAASTQELGAEAYEVLMSTFSYDTGYPLNARVVGDAELDELTFERIAFDSFHGGAVPGLLAIPTSGEQLHPLVLLLHGLTSDKSAWLKSEFMHGGELTKGLLAAGYAVMMLDAQYHGDRAVYNDYIDPGEMIFRHRWGARYSNMLTQSIVDYRRAIDYLGTRDEIDLNRIGIIGYSMGGHMTFLLAASEPRVKTIVSCVVPETPGMLTAASTFVRSLENKPLLMMMAQKDQFYTVEFAQQLFDSVPGDSKSLRFFDSGHSLPIEYTAQVVEWVDENL